MVDAVAAVMEMLEDEAEEEADEVVVLGADEGVNSALFIINKILNFE